MGGEWMIGKFASALRLLVLRNLVLRNLVPRNLVLRSLALPSLLLAILLTPRGFSQTTPADQTSPASAPAAQQPPAQQPSAGHPSTDQESVDEVSSSRRNKPREFKNWTYDVGAGVNLDSGTTRTFVRGGGVVGTAGVARNVSKYLGLRADFIFADLPLRQSSLSLAQAQSATSYFFAGTIDPIINIPVTKLWGGYILFGPGYYHRSGTLNSSAAVPGSACNPFFEWWGSCPNVSIPISGSFVSADENQFGYNFGAGITRKMPSGVELYAEYRLTHGSSNGVTTDVRPITVGVRW
jgi:opacity protein-like surface antigen